MVILTFIFFVLSISFISYILYNYFHGPYTNIQANLHGKIAIVTGANAGIGRETALDLLRRGAKVIFAARDETKSFQIINSISNPSEKSNAIYIKLDLSNFDSIRNFVQRIKQEIGNIDILVNNAGSLFDSYKKAENIEYTLITNHIGPVVLTSLLLDSINAKGRIINVSSMGHEFINQEKFNNFINDIDFEKAESTYHMFTSYTFSKLGNVIYTQYLNDYLQNNNREIKVVSLHPGSVLTDISTRFSNSILKLLDTLTYYLRKLCFKSALEGAQTSIHTAIINYDNLEGGKYYNNCEVQVYSPIARNKENIRKMIDFTRRLIEKNMNNTPKEVIQQLSLK